MQIFGIYEIKYLTWKEKKLSDKNKQMKSKRFSVKWNCVLPWIMRSIIHRFRRPNLLHRLHFTLILISFVSNEANASSQGSNSSTASTTMTPLSITANDSISLMPTKHRTEGKTKSSWIYYFSTFIAIRTFSSDTNLILETWNERIQH